MEREAYTIEEFCRSHGFSRAHYFNLRKDGRGPRVMHVGARVLISRESATDWRRSCEIASSPEAA